MVWQYVVCVWLYASKRGLTAISGYAFGSGTVDSAMHTVTHAHDAQHTQDTRAWHR
jgi:hypothetical protein